MNNKLTTIDPNQGNIPDAAIIQKVVSENDRLPNGEHEKAVKAFYFSDSIASGIGKDFAFVEKIPQLISDIIDNKSWECLYVSRGVVTPYYCRYTKGTNSENFRAFIAAKRPNGLETSIETIDRLLEADIEVRNKFRSIIYQSRQGERTDLDNDTCYSDYNKLEDSIGKIQKARIRAANRAAEAIPEIRELLDRGLIAIDVAAKLGRDIKDPDNLTAEEREYIDKRDLVGYRINQYINTNIIPEDEDKEPAYSRKLNEFIKDLLGIKNRSKSVRMDNPKKAAEKLLQFYEGKKLKELVDYLYKAFKEKADETDESSSNDEKVSSSVLSTPLSKIKSTKDEDCQKDNIPNQETSNGKVVDYQSASTVDEEHQHQENTNSQQMPHSIKSSDNILDRCLTTQELAKRLGIKRKTISDALRRNQEKFTQWSQNKDPDNLGWTRTEEKKGRSFLFAPVHKNQEGD